MTETQAADAAPFYRDPTWWQKEPTIIIGFLTALATVAASLGFNVSNETAGGITSAITFVFIIGGSLFIRRQVDSPATSALRSRNAAALHGQVQTAEATAETQTYALETLAWLKANPPEQEPTGPSPDSALHPLAVTPPIGGFPQ